MADVELLKKWMKVNRYNHNAVAAAMGVTASHCSVIFKNNRFRISDIIAFKKLGMNDRDVNLIFLQGDKK